MTVKHQMYRGLLLLGLLAMLSPGCRRPEAPKKAKPEAPAPEAEPSSVPGGAPGEEPPPTPSGDGDVLPLEGDIVIAEVTPELEPAPEPVAAPAVDGSRPIRTRTKAPSNAAPDLRTKLNGMRRSLDRRLLWARRAIERRAILESERDRLAERTTALKLSTQVPLGPQTDALGGELEEAARRVGLRITDLSFEEVPPDLNRLPDVFTGDRPLELTEADFIGTVRVSFVLGTSDKSRLETWYQALPDVPRFFIVNRIRYTGEAFQVIGEAYYRAAREGPLRREVATDIDAELKRVGVELSADAVRQQDPDHFLLAAAVSLEEYEALRETANEVSVIDASIKRSEVILAWYADRVTARAGRPLERLFR
jgi:hypothetical protein